MSMYFRFTFNFSSVIYTAYELLFLFMYKQSIFKTFLFDCIYVLHYWRNKTKFQKRKKKKKKKCVFVYTAQIKKNTHHTIILNEIAVSISIFVMDDYVVNKNENE